MSLCPSVCMCTCLRYYKLCQLRYVHTVAIHQECFRFALISLGNGLHCLTVTAFTVFKRVNSSIMVKTVEKGAPEVTSVVGCAVPASTTCLPSLNTTSLSSPPSLLVKCPARPPERLHIATVTLICQ